MTTFPKLALRLAIMWQVCSSRDAQRVEQVHEHMWEGAASPFKLLKMQNMGHNTKNHIQLRCRPAMAFMLASN